MPRCVGKRRNDRQIIHPAPRAEQVVLPPHQRRARSLQLSDPSPHGAHFNAGTTGLRRSLRQACGLGHRAAVMQIYPAVPPAAGRAVDPVAVAVVDDALKFRASYLAAPTLVIQDLVLRGRRSRPIDFGEVSPVSLFGPLIATGTTFSLRIPARLLKVATAWGRADERRDSLSVLVVDELADARASLGDVTQRPGPVCHAGGSAARARPLLASAHFDAVLIDLERPDTDGPAWATEIRERGGPDAESMLILISAAENQATGHSWPSDGFRQAFPGRRAYLPYPPRARSRRQPSSAPWSRSADPRRKA